MTQLNKLLLRVRLIRELHSKLMMGVKLCILYWMVPRATGRTMSKKVMGLLGQHAVLLFV